MNRILSLGLQALFVCLLIGAAMAYINYPQYVMEDILGYKADTKTSKKKRRGPRVAPVIVDNVIEKTNDTIIEAIGDGRAVRFVTLFPESAGEIVEFTVSAGDEVKKGDTILKLNTRKAELAVKIAEANVLEAERKLRRASTLRKQKVASKANVDDAQTELRKAALALEQAKEALNDRILQAPFDGVIGIPKVEEGDRVTTTTAIVTLDDRSALTVEFDVPEYFYAQLKADQKLQARTPSHADVVFTGTVKAIDSRIEATSRSVKVRAEIPNVNDTLRPGMSFSVQITIAGKSYPTVPELALQWGNGESYIWKIVNGKAQRVKVRMIKRVNSMILIEGKVSKGDLIVIEGVQRLRNGIQVKYSRSSTDKTQQVSKLEAK